MAGLTDAFETAVLEQWFNNNAIANIGDAAGLPASAAAGSTQLALASVVFEDSDTLLTADELAYTGYTRPTQARSAAGWDVVGDTASNAALVEFGEMTAGGPVTAVSQGIGLIATGDILRLFGATNSLVINDGINPRYVIGALEVTLD
jgi:hypothetical protein